MIVTFITNPARWRAGAPAAGDYGPQPAQRGAWVTGHRWSGRPGGPGDRQQLVVGCVRADSLERTRPPRTSTSSHTGPVLGGGGVLTVLLGQDHPGRPWPGGHDAPACGPGAPLSTRGPGRWTRTHKAPPAGKQGAAAATHATRLLRALRLRYPCWLPCQVLFWRRGEPARGTAGQHRPAANLSGHLRLERALRNRARQPRDQYGHGDRFRPWARAPTVIAN